MELDLADLVRFIKVALIVVIFVVLLIFAARAGLLFAARKCHAGTLIEGQTIQVEEASADWLKMKNRPAPQ